MTANLKLLATLISLLFSLDIFVVSATKEIQFVQVLSVNKFYAPSYLDSNSTAFGNRIDLNYEHFLKNALDIPNGIKMHLFNLGTYLRQMYGTFLGDLYFDDLMKMQTTEFPVSIIAGELINAGLWPPVGQQIWKEDLAWQPIPFDYLPRDEDQILLGTLCPNYELETQAVLKSHKNLSAEHKNLLDYINKEAQLELKNPIDVSLFYLAVENSISLRYAGDLIKTNFSHEFSDKIYLESNKTLPAWLKKIYPSDALTSLAMQAYDLLSKTALQKRLNGGPFLKQLIEDCKKHANKSSAETMRIKIFSGDERNLAGVLNNLNQPISELPKAGSALIFELYAENQKYFIKMNYYTGNETLNDLALAGCQIFCPIERFEELLKDILPENATSLCGSQLDSGRGSSSMLHSNWNIISCAAVFLATAYGAPSALTGRR